MFDYIKIKMAVRKERKMAIKEAKILMPLMYDAIKRNPECTLAVIRKELEIDESDMHAMLVSYRTLQLLNKKNLLLLSPPDNEGDDIVECSKYSVISL